MKKLGHKRLEIEYSCPVEATLDIIGGKWKSLILFYLLPVVNDAGKLRFGELKRMLPGITQRMLTLQLRELEEDGIIHRHVYREVPPKVEYSLTDFGLSLQPILLAMRAWGNDYMQSLATFPQSPREQQDVTVEPAHLLTTQQ
jgi:DNA-binding HxlR family transcriptional regulator